MQNITAMFTERNLKKKEMISNQRKEISGLRDEVQKITQGRDTALGNYKSVKEQLNEIGHVKIIYLNLIWREGNH